MVTTGLRFCLSYVQGRGSQELLLSFGHRADMPDALQENSSTTQKRCGYYPSLYFVSLHVRRYSQGPKQGLRSIRLDCCLRVDGKKVNE